jgi:ribokinase
MQTNPQVLVVGSLNIDLVCNIPHLPREGETVMGSAFNTFVGGKGFNQAVAARRSGSTVGIVGKLGQDAYGKLVTKALIEENINDNGVTCCIDNKVSTGVAMIMVDRQGNNIITVVPGTNFRLDAGDIEASRSLIQKAKVVLLQLEIPLESCLRAARLAHDAGAKVILTCAPVPTAPLPAELLALVDILVLNEIELQQLAQLHFSAVDINPHADEETTAYRLLNSQKIRTDTQAGPKAILVTLGARGALWVSATENRRVAGFAVEVVDTTAAGDTFTGALATALAAGNSVQDALGFANAAAALTVTKAGASNSIPNAVEIEKLLHSPKNIPTLAKI